MKRWPATMSRGSVYASAAFAVMALESAQGFGREVVPLVKRMTEVSSGSASVGVSGGVSSPDMMSESGCQTLESSVASGWVRRILTGIVLRRSWPSDFSRSAATAESGATITPGWTSLSM